MLAAGFAASAIVKAISTLYNVAGDINIWMDNHIRGMKASDNQTIARTGKVLEGAKTGFGIGYVAPVTVIAVGQFLLGNTMAAAGTLATAVTLTNPFAMTCAAVGAIYYGWSALSNEEQKDVLDKISAGLEIGIEFIKSVINFIISTSKEVLNSKNFTELKDFVRKAANDFGRKLGDITHAVTDKMADAAQATKSMTQSWARKTVKGAKKASQAVSETATNITKSIKMRLDQNGDGHLGIDDVHAAGRRTKKALTRKSEA